MKTLDIVLKRMKYCGQDFLELSGEVAGTGGDMGGVEVQLGKLASFQHFLHSLLEGRRPAR